MKKLTLCLSLMLSSAAFSQEQQITMEMIPVYSVNTTEGQVEVITTYPIDVYINDVLHPITTAGFYTFKVTEESRVMILPHQEY